METKGMKTTETVTTLESILKGNELKTFKAAQTLWTKESKNTLKHLENMSKVGSALNLLYTKGESKGLKRDAITDMARSAFVGLDRRERSDYRALAVNFVEVKCFVNFANIKSLNPTYLLNSWRKAMTEDRADVAQIEKQRAGGVDVQGVNMDEKDEVVKETPKVVSEQVIKTGITVKSDPLTPKEVVKQLGYVVNQVKTMFNKGELNADHLSIIEEHLTSGLQHINNVESDSLLKATM